MSISKMLMNIEKYPSYPKKNLLKVTDITEEQFASMLRHRQVIVDHETQFVSLTDEGKQVKAMGMNIRLTTPVVSGR